MKCSMRVKAVVFLVISLMICVWAGSAWAASRAEVQLYHRVRVSTNSGVTDFSTMPEFREVFLRVSHPGFQTASGKSSGTFTFNFKNDLTIDSEGNDAGIQKSGPRTFTLWPDEDSSNSYDYSFPGDDDGNEILFLNGAESALNESVFSYTLGDGTNVTGKKFPPIQSAQAQFDNKRVPFIELDFDSDNKTVKGVNWRLVDPSDTKTALKNSLIGSNSGGIIDISIKTKEDYISYPLWGEIRDDLGGYISFTSTILFDDLRRVTLSFYNPDGDIEEDYYNDNGREDGYRVTVTEQWYFVVNGDDDDDDDDFSGAKLVPETDLPTVKTVTASNLTNGPKADDIITLDTDHGTGVVYTGTNVITNSGAASIDAWRTSSIISVKQEVAEGGALAFTNKLPFVLKSKSLENAELSQPVGFNDLKNKYSVLKHFENAGAVDLLAEFGEIFSYDPDEKRVMLNATIIIIDDTAPDPANEDGLRTYFNNKYGIKLVTHESGKYLYIWDGLKNKSASDPIALTAKANQGGGGGGCNAGFGMFGLLLFAGLAALKTGRRKPLK